MAKIYCLDSSSETDGITKFSSDFQGQSYKLETVEMEELRLFAILMVKV